MTAWLPGALAPQPGAAPVGRMLAAQTKAELMLLMRNGEQILLTLVIPLGLLLVLSKVDFVTVPGGRDRRRVSPPASPGRPAAGVYRCKRDQPAGANRVMLDY